MIRLGYTDDGSLGASLAIFGYSDSARLGVSLAVCLAGAHPERLKIEDLASLTGSTYASTGRALRLLASGHMARSTRGPRGGWRLSRPASTIKLLDVLAPFCLDGAPTWGMDDGDVSQSRGGNGHSLDWLVRKAKAAAVTELAGITLAELLGDDPVTDQPLRSEVEAQQAS